jgi:Leucine-rich repeat (LRR) protein
MQTLNLVGNFLNGTIPDTIGNLTSLTYLSLGQNQLTGHIPETLGRHQRLLQNILLFVNHLSGPIPASLGNITDLLAINARLNKLSGTLPAELGNATKLTNLIFFENRLQGTIPKSFQQLTALTELALSSNNLTGTVPPELARLPSLLILDLALNFFTGTFPQAFDNKTNLQQLTLQNNHFSGTLPEVLYSSTGITHFSAQCNHFTGGISTAFANLTSLDGSVYLYGNLLTGSIPTVICSNPAIADFEAFLNQLTGTIPPQIGNWRNMTFFELYGNHLTGSIPDTIADLPLMTQLYLYQNYLTSTIPSGINNMNNLQTLFMYGNLLSGTIPQGFGRNQTSLQYLYLYENLLTGNIPATLFEAPLILLEMSYNFLSGSIPSTLAACKHLNSLQLGSNELTGSLDGVFNATLQRALTTIQVDNNRFTSSIPAEIFQLPKLVTVVAADNCFRGKLPTTLCMPPFLQSLVLDGLSSAPACQQKILPGVTNSYAVRHIVSGTVPACVYALLSLQTLHLSGNGFTGSLAVDAGVSLALSDLTVSHNILTGTVPARLLHRAWLILDLSYNRLTGSLPPDVFNESFSVVHGTASGNQTTLSLEDNRLSGNIPGSLLEVEGITMLSGNVFSCRVDGSDLPKHDSERDSYECGSDGFNLPYYVWLMAVGVLAVGVAMAFVRSGSAYASARRWLNRFDQKQGREVAALWDTARCILELSVGVTAYSVLVLLPLYVALSHYKGTILHQYAWTLSSAFLTGATAAGLEMALWVLLLALFVLALLVRTSSVAAKVSDPSSEKSVPPPDAPPRLRLMAYAATYIVVDIFVVAGVNIAYVYVAIYRTSTELVFAQVWMALFKMAWNNTGAEALLMVIAKLMATDKAVKAAALLKLRVFVTLLNNIVIPCVAAACVSPSCFYNMFVQAPEVTSTYNTPVCTILGLIQCDSYVPMLHTVTYDPPFRYSYQCSSSLITYYAPAFVNLCIVSTFVAPAFGLVGLRLHHTATPGTRWHRMLTAVLPKLWLPLPAEPSAEDRVFKGSSAIVNTVNFLGLILTFGVVFPPLAVALVVTACAAAFLTKLTLGRFLYFGDTVGRSTVYAAVLERECEAVGASGVLRSALWMLVTVSCLFYTLFLFETLGDAVGFRGAYWVFIVMPLVPLCLYATVHAAGHLLPSNLAGRRDSESSNRMQSVVELRSTESSLDKLERARSSVTVNMMHSSLTAKIESM